MAETVRGINIKLGIDNSGLDTGLQGLNKELKNTQKNLNAVSRLTRIDPKNIEALTRKQEELTKAIKNTEKRLELQTEELKKAEQQFGRNSEEYDLAQRRIDRTNAELAKFEKQLKQTNTQLKKLSLEKFEKIEKIGKNLLPVTGAIVGISAGLVKLTKDVADVGDEIAKTAKTIGLSAEELQEYRFIADRLGVSNSTLESSFLRLSRNIGDVLVGATSEATEAFETLGIELLDSEGVAKSTNDVFLEVRDALSKVEDESIRASLATDIFGRSGIELNNLFLEETETIQGLIDEVNELGIISNEEAIQAEALADQQRNLEQQFINVKNTLAVGLFPVFEELISFISERIVPAVQELVTGFVELDSDTKKLIAVLGGLVASVGPVLIIGAKLGKLLTTLKFAFTAVGQSGILAGQGISVATLGIGALIAIVGVAIATNEELREKFLEIGETILEAVVPIFEVLGDVIASLTPVIELVADLLVTLLNPVLDLLLSILEPIADIFILLTPLIKTLLTPITALGKVFEALSPILIGVLDLLNPIFDVLTGISNIVSSGISGFADLIGIDLASAENSTPSRITPTGPTTNTTNNVTIEVNGATEPALVAEEIDNRLGRIVP